MGGYLGSARGGHPRIRHYAAVVRRFRVADENVGLIGFIRFYLLAPDKEKGKVLLQSCDGEAHEYDRGELFRSGIT